MHGRTLHPVLRRFALGLAFAGGLTVSAHAQTLSWCFPLSGAEQSPPINTAGAGNAVVKYDTATNTLSWNISYHSLAGNQTAAHFHGPAGVGQNGGVQQNIGTGNPLVGSAVISDAQAGELIAGLWYVNIHSSMFGGGEIRGQVDDGCGALQVWNVTASGSEEVPSNNSSGTASGLVILDRATNDLSWSIAHAGLSGAPSMAHLHGPAPVGSNAGVQVNIGVASNPIVGNTTLTQQQADDLSAGLWYLNVHTGMFPSGEIRGQLDDTLARTHCTSVANSFDASGARLTTAGDFTASNNALTLTATGVPPSNFGYLLLGQSTGTSTPPGSSGVLCLIGGPIGRFNSQVLLSDGAGVMGPFTPDLSSLPNPPGGSIQSGETWCFQAWFRDGGTNNFTDAVLINFL